MVCQLSSADSAQIFSKFVGYGKIQRETALRHIVSVLYIYVGLRGTGKFEINQDRKFLMLQNRDQNKGKNLEFRDRKNYSGPGSGPGFGCRVSTGRTRVTSLLRGKNGVKVEKSGPPKKNYYRKLNRVFKLTRPPAESYSMHQPNYLIKTMAIAVWGSKFKQKPKTFIQRKGAKAVAILLITFMRR